MTPSASNAAEVFGESGAYRTHAPSADTPSRGERVKRRRGVFIELALLGVRRGELAGLRLSAVQALDTDTATLTVQRNRVAVEGAGGRTTAVARTLLLPSETVQALRGGTVLAQTEDKECSGSGWRGDTDLYILTKDNGAGVSPRTPDSWWHAAMEAAGVEGYRPHVMRHTAASRLISAGICLTEIATWLGHADGGVLALRVYGQTDPADLNRAAAALGRTRNPYKIPTRGAPLLRKA